MKGKAVSGIMLTLLLIGILPFVFKVPAVYTTPSCEDLLTYTEVDPNNHIYVASSTHVDFTADSDDEAYLYKDYGVDYFGNIEHDLDLRCVSTNNYWNEAPTWCLSNDVDDVKGLTDNHKTAIMITFHRHQGSETYLNLRETYGGVEYESSWFLASYGTWYYITITKESTTFQLKIYSDSSRSNLLTTTNLTLHGDWKFRYLFVCQNHYDNTNKQHVIEIENLAFMPHAITILSPGNKAYATTSVPLTFTVNETASWMGYSLDDQANVTVAGNTTLAGLLEGSHNVVVYANSTAGTMWASSPVYFTVDLTPPTVSVLSPENTTYTAASVPLTFTVNESTSWIGYSLDDQANVTISGNTALNIQTNGSHSVIVYAKDMAGNTAASNRVFFTVELPVGGSCAISVEPSKNIVALGQTVTATITFTDIMDCVGYQFVIDYNATVLEYVGYTFDTDPANPLSATQMAPASSDRVDTDASVPGSVKLATVWKAGVPSYSGSGVAAKITFQALTAGNSTLVFDQPWTRAIDYNANDILFAEFNDNFIAVVVAMQSIIVDSSMEIVQSCQTVTFTVNITDITDCAGYQFKIDYNPAILALDSWTLDTGTPLTPSQMAPAAAQRLDTNLSVPGSVKLATVWKAGVPSYSGNGVAAKITFQALTAGNSTLVFDQPWTIAVNSVGEEILFGGFNDGWVVVTVQGDVDSDHDVDVADQRKVQLAMFSTYPDPLYIQYNTYPIFTDVDGDGDVDVGDQRKQALNMFQSW